MKQGTIYLLTGVSGGGKTTILRELRKRHPHIYSPISVTNRPPRENETNGINYEFVSLNDFEVLKNRDGLFVWSHTYGNYYGLRKESILEQINKGNDVLFETVVESASKLHLIDPSIKIVFLATDSLETQSTRLSARGMSKSDLNLRLEIAKGELEWARKNNIPTVTTGDIGASVMKVERLFQLISPAPAPYLDQKR